MINNMVVSCGEWQKIVSICEDRGLPFQAASVKQLHIGLRRCITFSFSFLFYYRTYTFQCSPSSALPTPTIHHHMDPTIVITTPSVYASSPTVLVLQILFLSIQKMLVILRVQMRIHAQAPSFWHSVLVGWSIDQRAQTMITNTACVMAVVRISRNDQCSSVNLCMEPLLSN